MHHRTLPSAFALLLGLGLGVGCNNGGSFVNGPGGNPVPVLDAADLPSVSPCPNQDILADQALLDVFKVALAQGTYLYLDVPYDALDLDIFKKKCGYETFWDPTDNVDEVAPTNTPVTLADLFEFGNAGICAAGFDAGSFGTGEGFPEAGVYRKEFKVANAGVTYLVRVRVTISGTAAGDTFLSSGITVPTDLVSVLGYEVNGVNRTHGNLLLGTAAVLQVPYPSATLDILDVPGGTVILSALVEFLCVEVL